MKKHDLRVKTLQKVDQRLFDFINKFILDNTNTSYSEKNISVNPTAIHYKIHKSLIIL